jgi:S-DNA-T family DNA segregation ATPase FtsK/SpoIIIE
MPHLLVAGTTGSGKSVAVNAMVLSLLYKATAERCAHADDRPEDAGAQRLPGHPASARAGRHRHEGGRERLRWCVAEMERRYKLMSAVGVRNLAGFNKKVKDAKDAGQPMLDPLFRPNPELQEAPPTAGACRSSSSSSTNSPT